MFPNVLLAMQAIRVTELSRLRQKNCSPSHNGPCQFNYLYDVRASGVSFINSRLLKKHSKIVVWVMLSSDHQTMARGAETGCPAVQYGYVVFRSPDDGQRCRNWVPCSTVWVMLCSDHQTMARGAETGCPACSTVWVMLCSDHQTMARGAETGCPACSTIQCVYE